MATPILTGIGTAIGGPVGGAIGALLGSYVDQRFFFPALFPPDDQIGPKLNDLRLTLAEEGAVFARLFGKARVPAAIIWCSDNIEHIDEQNIGKGGGSGGNAVIYTYQAFVAIAYAARGSKQKSALVTDGIKQLYFDGKKMWDRDPDIDLQAFSPTQGVVSVQYYTNWSFHKFDFLELESGPGGFNLNEFGVGKEVVVTGFTGAYTNNNSAFSSKPIFVFSTRYGSGVDINKTYVTLARRWKFSDTHTSQSFTAVPLASGQLCNIFQSSPRFNPAILFDDPTFYTGTETQQPDATIESFDGVGSTPGYRGLAYSVVHMNTQDFANRIPNTCEAVCASAELITVGEAIVQICEERDLPDTNVDVSLCSEELNGYSVVGPSSGVAMLQPLMLAYDLIPQMRDVTLHFFPRDQAPVVVIADGDVGSFEYGTEFRGCIQVNDADETDMLNEVVCRYQDLERHYQTGAQVSRLSNRIGGINQAIIDLAVVMTSARGRGIAERTLRRAYQGMRRITFTLPPEYIGVVRESTICEFNADGRAWRVLTDKVDRGNNFVLLCEGTEEDSRLATQVESADLGTGPQEFTGGTESQARALSPGRMLFEIIDAACLHSVHADTPGFYAVACQSDRTVAFRGGILMRSDDGGETFSEAGRFTHGGTMGVVETPPSTTAIPGFWDITSQMVIRMFNGQTLASVTDAQCESGANNFLIGNEVIGVVNCVPLGDDRYLCTRLRRGLQGTEHAVAEHVAGMRAVFISGPGIEFFSINHAVIGETRFYKCVGSGMHVEDCDEDEVVHLAANVMPLAPVNVRAARNSLGDASIAFTPRSRGVVSILGAGGSPSYEAHDEFTIEIMDPLDVAVPMRRNTVASRAARVATAYGNVYQSADGITPGDPFTVRVRQKSSLVGLGRATVTEV